MSDRDTGNSPVTEQRVKVVTSHERWFDIDAAELRAYFGNDVPDELKDAIEQSIWDGDDVPSWLSERGPESDYYSVDVEVLGVCEKHSRVMDTTQYGSKEPGCGSCWIEGYDARKATGVPG